MEKIEKEITLFGKYLKKIKASQSKIADVIGIKSKRISLLSTEETASPYADEFYKIVYIANHQAGLEEESFYEAIDEIFPNLPQIDLLAEFKDLSPEAQLFKKYTQKQGDIEEKLGIAPGKISKYFGNKNKRALAIEIISFAKGMALDILEVFKAVYGKIGEIECNPLPSPAVLNERVNNIYQYIDAYNQSDVLNMITNMADTIVFVNITNNQPTMQSEGIDEFKKQATEAISYFSHRQQTIISMTHRPNSTEIIVDYKAIAAVDFPNEIKKGDEIKLRGKSIFKFSQEGKIIELRDVS